MKILFLSINKIVQEKETDEVKAADVEEISLIITIKKKKGYGDSICYKKKWKSSNLQWI